MKKGKYPKFSVGGYYSKNLKNLSGFLADNAFTTLTAGLGSNIIKQNQYDDTGFGRELGKNQAMKESFDSMQPLGKMGRKFGLTSDSQNASGMNDAQYQEYQKWQPIATAGSKVGEAWAMQGLGGTNGMFNMFKKKPKVSSNSQTDFMNQQRQDQFQPAENSDAYYNTIMAHGGKMPNLYNMGGKQPNAEVENDEFITSHQLPKVMGGGNIEMASNNPYSNPTFKTNGLTHEEGGIKVNLAPGSIINGKTKNPLTGNKFTKDMDLITKQENRFTKHAEKGGIADTTSNIMLKALAFKKDYYNKLQNAIIENKERAKNLSKGILDNSSIQEFHRMGGIQKFDGGGRKEEDYYTNVLDAEGQRTYQKYFNDASKYDPDFNPDNYTVSNFVKTYYPQLTKGYKPENQEVVNPTGSNGKSSDWKNTAGNIGMFLANNMGNLYNLSRYNKPEVEKYERATPTYLDPTASVRDAKRIERNTFKKIKDAATGNAATALSNYASARANTTMDIDKINRDYANANAGIANQFNMYNTGLSKEEVIANAMNRARNRSGQGEAIGNIGYNTANQMRDRRLEDMDQKTLAMMYEYYDYPNFRKSMEKSGFRPKNNIG